MRYYAGGQDLRACHLPGSGLPYTAEPFINDGNRGQSRQVTDGYRSCPFRREALLPSREEGVVLNFPQRLCVLGQKSLSRLERVYGSGPARG